MALYLVKWWARTTFSGLEKGPKDIQKDFFHGLEISEHEEAIVYLFVHFLRHSKKVMTIHRHQIDYKRAYQHQLKAVSRVAQVPDTARDAAFRLSLDD